jgi:hypothetical protein
MGADRSASGAWRAVSRVARVIAPPALGLALAWLPACAAKKAANLAKPATATAKADGAPAPAPLVGHVTRADLEGYVTWKELRAQDYTPDPAAVTTIAERSGGTSVLAIVATWCRDSRREVPRFFKIADQAKYPLDRVTLVAVDRTKKDAEGLTEKHGITRVPTFVLFRNGQEIGRVTEKAQTTLENDIAAILNK